MNIKKFYEDHRTGILGGSLLATAGGAAFVALVAIHSGNKKDDLDHLIIPTNYSEIYNASEDLENFPEEKYEIPAYEGDEQNSDDSSSEEKIIPVRSEKGPKIDGRKEKGLSEKIRNADIEGLLKMTGNRFGPPSLETSNLPPYECEVYGFPLVGEKGYQLDDASFGTKHWRKIGLSTTLVHGIQYLTELHLEDEEGIRNYVSWYLDFRAQRNPEFYGNRNVKIVPENIVVVLANGTSDIRLKNSKDRFGKDLPRNVVEKNTNHILVDPSERIWVPKTILKK